MAKATVQDIVLNKTKPGSVTPAGKLSFPPAGGSGLPPFERKYGDEPTAPKRRLYAMTIIATVAFAVFMFSLSIFFVSATVIVYPKSKTVHIDKVVESNKTSGSELVFDVVTLTGKESMTLPATGTKEVRKKASGTVIIYNDYSSKSQKLIKNTRFETPDNKIYRIDSSIVVPGTKVVRDKTIPGSVEAVVFADEPGDKYNIGKTDFTIPGFKGDPRYGKFYARSKTDMEGGEIGTVFTLSESDNLISNSTLKKKISESLMKDADKNIPPDFIFYDDTVFMEYGPIKTIAEEGDKNITVEQTGKIYAVIIRRAGLAKFIAKSQISDFDGAPVSSPTLSDLSVKIKNKELVDTGKIEFLNIGISGTTTIVWDFDKDALVNNLLGKPKKNFHAILANYPNITRADLSLTPFWALALPEKSSDIIIKTVIE